jgi:hypothetical protein
VGLALTFVERLAIGIAPCQTGDCYRLASQGISPLLEMEASVLQTLPNGISGSSQSDPANGASLTPAGELLASTALMIGQLSFW